MSTRSPLKSKNENVLSTKLGSMSLGNKENTVSKCKNMTKYVHCSY